MQFSAPRVFLYFCVVLLTASVFWLSVGTASPAVAAENGLAIATAGKSDYLIVTPAAPSPTVVTAACELQEHLEQVTGAKLAIVGEDKAPADAKAILIGPSDRAKKLLPGVDPDKLPKDAVVIKTVGDNLILVGHPTRGTLYAVFTFLEDAVGCRWWTPEESFIPKKPDLTVPALDVNYAPKLIYREAYYRNAFECRFAARSKCNGMAEQISPEYGGHYLFAGFVHTFFPLLPPDKYFADHPEWYSMIDGKRKHEYAQLCLTNGEMRKEFIKNALARLAANPGANIISISQNDWYGNCQCERCKAVDAEEGSPSGSLLRFVNAVAEEIEKQYPDVLVETLAYQYTRKPPLKVRPRKNVIVRLCTIECSFSQPLEGEQNKTFRDDIEGWSKIAPQLFVWDYVTNFSNYILPHPNMRVLAPNIRFFVKNNVIGLFEQGDAGSNIGDFVRMRAWVISHLMWNPELDENALIQEFLTGYYGPAAPHLLAYLNHIHDSAERSGAYVGCFTQDTKNYLTTEDLFEARRLYDKALEAVAGDETLSRRVRRERLALDHTWIDRFNDLLQLAKSQGKPFIGTENPAECCEEFIRLAKEHNVGQFSEQCAFTQYEDRLRRKIRPLGPAPEQCKNLPADKWIDVQDNRFNYNDYGKLCTIIEDKNASDSQAARMPGDHFEWAVSYSLPSDLTKEGVWHCYALARCDATAADGPAMTMGIYDGPGRKNMAHLAITVKELAGPEYRVFDLGSRQITDGMYFWAAPPKRPGEVQAVYVDRVFMIREK